MTLLITVFAAVISTVVWYHTVQKTDMKLGTLCVLYWGASIMWFVDAVYEYTELHGEYFTPDIGDMVNDAFLGLSVVALGLVIWLVRFLLADPKGVISSMLFRSKNEEAKTVISENSAKSKTER